MKPTILITGGAGYIGSHTAYLMAQMGHETVIIDKFLHGQQFDSSWTTVFKKDFADEEMLDYIFKNYNIKAIMHFAAFIEVGRSVKDPLKFYDNNVIKTIKLLEKMIQYGINTFIFSSSCAVYGSPQKLPLTEDHPKSPISPYGKNKLAVEMVLEDFCNAYNLKYVSLRYFNAAGAKPEYGLGEQHKPETHIIPLILQAAKQQKPIYVFGVDYSTKDGSCIRDFIHVWDLAYAHHLAFEHLQAGKPSDCFNLGSGQGFSVKEIINAISKICGTKIKIIEEKKRPGDPPILLSDPSKAHNILKWQPKYSDLDFIIKTANAFETQRITNFL